MNTKYQKRNLSVTKREALLNIIWCAIVLALLCTYYVWKHSGDDILTRDGYGAEAVISQNLRSNEIVRSIYGNVSGKDIGPDGIDDTVTAVVECETTRGQLIMDVRAGWSPIGAEQFLKLVEIGHFTDLPFTRVAPRYITQYGRKYIAPDSPRKGYLKRGGITQLQDDPSMWGKRDMDFGYMFYAGSGANSRFDELVTALCPMKGCIQTGLGKALWETPVATIRAEYFDILNAIMESGKPYPRLEMAGQHPDAGGPNPSKLANDPNYLKQNYPFMEYWLKCEVVEKGVQQARPVSQDHPNSVQRGLEGYPKPAKTKATVTTSNGDTTPFKVIFELVLDTEKPEEISKVIIEILPQWAPLGAEQFRKLISTQFYDQARFFRVLPKFMAQFGINEFPSVGTSWKTPIKDDVNNTPLTEGNKRGHLTFAMAGPNTRTSQMFINTVDNAFLDKQGFTPIGRVIEGIEHVDAINDEYKEKPDQGKILQRGNEYLTKAFPRLSYIQTARMA